MQTNTQDAKQRGYSFLAGVPVGEYIRRRRLTLAAQDIRAGSERLIDIALRYGYDSQAAFARAFKQVFGVTPSSVRSGAALVAYPKITFESIVKERDGGMGKYSERVIPWSRTPRSTSREIWNRQSSGLGMYWMVWRCRCEERPRRGDLCLYV